MPYAYATDLSTVIQIRHLMTPIGLVHPVGDRDDTDAVYERMLAKNYSATTVVRGEEVIGWVTRDDLAEHSGKRVGAVLRVPSTDVLVGSGSSVQELLERFRQQRHFLLVVGASGIEGIATPSDIGRQAGRMYLFTKLCALELALASLARSRDDVKTLIAQELPRRRRELIDDSLGKRVKDGQVADTVAVLHFLDLLRMGKSMSAGWPEVDDAKLRDLNDLRNAVVHAPNEVADDGAIKINNVLANLDLASRFLAAVESAAA